MEEKQYILFDPVTCERRKIDYQTLSEITRISRENLSTHKTKKIKIRSINSYFLDADISKKELRELLEKEKIKDEIFLDIPNTNGMYQASNYGRIKSNYKNSFLVLYKRDKNKKNKHVKWLFTHIKMNGKVKEIAVHRLIAMTFLGIEEDKVVIHKNRILHDNKVCNLEYMDKKHMVKFCALSHPKPVAKLHPETLEVLEEYPSMAEAARQNFMHKATIPHCLKRANSYAGGFKWKVIEE